MNDLTVIRGDTVTLTATLVDPLGAAYDLTGAELTFSVADLSPRRWTMASPWPTRCRARPTSS